MVRWMEMIADRLEPVYNMISAKVLGGDCIQMAETSELHLLTVTQNIQRFYRPVL